MNVINFIREYVKHPRMVGAILPSSTSLAKEMIKPIKFEQSSCIVEYGAGTGVFTDAIIQHKQKETLFLSIETNERFYTTLNQKYGHLENVHIIHGSAEKIDDYLAQYDVDKADYIVSGLPFTSLPQSVSTTILKKTVTSLSKDGKFITFQYSKVKQSFLQSFFKRIHSKRVYRNTPPAYVFTCI